MRAAVIQFPGSNCDRDMFDAIQQDLKAPVSFLWHKDSDLSAYSTEDCIVLPGASNHTQVDLHSMHIHIYE